MEEKTPGPALFFLGFALGEDDLVDEEENHHAYAAVQDGGADVIQPPGDKVPGHRHPDAVELGQVAPGAVTRHENVFPVAAEEAAARGPLAGISGWAL